MKTERERKHKQNVHANSKLQQVEMSVRNTFLPRDSIICQTLKVCKINGKHVLLLRILLSESITQCKLSHVHTVQHGSTLFNCHSNYCCNWTAEKLNVGVLMPVHIFMFVCVCFYTHTHKHTGYCVCPHSNKSDQMLDYIIRKHCISFCN